MSVTPGQYVPAGPPPATSVFSHPGPMNVFIPAFDTSAQLIVGYSRNPKEFVINDYVRYQTVDKIVGIYPKFLASDQIRMQYSDGRHLLWMDGDVRPVGGSSYEGARHAWIKYELLRYDLRDTAGYITVQQAAWDVIKKKQGDLAGRMMTLRTLLALSTLTTTGNWSTGHTNSVASWTGTAGDFWHLGSINNPIIGRTLQTVRNRILLDTNGKVKVEDLRLVINPNLAYRMSLSQEIRAYLAQQAGSLAVLQGATPSVKTTWGLPDPLYGFNLCVEYTPYVSAVKSTSDDTATFALSDNTAIVVSRPGSLDGEAGGSNFSTIHYLFLKGNEMRSQLFDDSRNELYDIFLTDFYTPLMVSPESGALITNCLS